MLYIKILLISYIHNMYKMLQNADVAKFNIAYKVINYNIIYIEYTCT